MTRTTVLFFGLFRFYGCSKDDAVLGQHVARQILKPMNSHFFNRSNAQVRLTQGVQSFREMAITFAFFIRALDNPENANRPSSILSKQNERVLGIVTSIFVYRESTRHTFSQGKNSPIRTTDATFQDIQLYSILN